MTRAALLVLAACGGASAPRAPVLANRGGIADTRPGEIEGEITDAKTGEPVPGATVVVTHAGEPAGSQITDAEGYFRVRGLVRDRYTLAIYYADLTIELADVAVEAGASTAADWKLDQTTTGGEVVKATWHPGSPKPHHAPKLSAGHGAVVGVVTSKKERVPLRALSVILKRGDGRELRAVTDHRGDFFFDDIAPGEYAASYDTPDGTTGALGPVHVAAGQITSADLTIELPNEDRD